MSRIRRQSHHLDVVVVGIFFEYDFDGPNRFYHSIERDSIERDSIESYILDLDY